jgi:hypothetical protein
MAEVINSDAGSTTDMRERGGSLRVSDAVLFPAFHSFLTDVSLSTIIGHDYPPSPPGTRTLPLFLPPPQRGSHSCVIRTRVRRTQRESDFCTYAGPARRLARAVSEVIMSRAPPT